MRNLLLPFIVLATAFSGCLQSDDGPDRGPEWTYEPTDSAPTVFAPDDESFDGKRFIAIGDQGTGGDDQWAVARQMETVCLARGCDFVVALGDNIYEIGTTSAYDEQFETKFEQPYANFSIPFYMTQGNHDNSADPISAQFGINAGIGHWYQTGDYEVDYHYRDDRTSDKWQMPSRYYDFQEGPATFFALDTNLLMYWGAGATLEAQDAPQPGDQAAWISAAMDTADTPWRIAVGHHPYLSNGQHGNAGDYEASAYGVERPDDRVPRPDPIAGGYVEMFFEEYVCGEVDLIITGHDHDLQWLEPHPDCEGTEQIVSGAAGKVRTAGNPDRNPAYYQQYETLGFMWAAMTDDSFTGVFYDVDGNVLFERTLAKAA